MAVVVARVEYRAGIYEATVTVDARIVWRQWYRQEGIAWKRAKQVKAKCKRQGRKEGQR